jgi:hypothetical protein
MIERKILEPNKTYLFTKEILATNQMFPGNRRKWSIETGRENLCRFLLPIGHVLNFTIVQNKLLMVITIHPPDVLKKVPRLVKDQSYTLEANTLDQYVNGKLQELAQKQRPTYEQDDLSKAIRKRFANFLQSFSIRYNRQYNRKDRLSARPTGIFEVQTEDDLRQLLSEIQNTPLIHGDKRDLNNCETNSYHLERKEVQKVISWKKVIDLFQGKLSVFQNAVRNIRAKLIRRANEFEYLKDIPPGWYWGRI